jgi:hypothetical protein
MPKVPIKVNLPNIGEIEIFLTEEQVKKAMNDGQNILKGNVYNYIFTGGMATTNTDNGFTGKDVDWSSFFPEVSIEDIRDLSEKAETMEKTKQMAALSACRTITAALNSYFGENETGFVNILKNRK